MTVSFVCLISTDLRAETPSFDADRAYDNLQEQCNFGPRNPGSEGYNRCLKWLSETLKDLTPEVYLQDFTAVNPVDSQRYKLRNIIARFEGSGLTPLMLCAHWDTRPWADLDPDPKNRKTPILGANDGASGVAVLLEIARIANEYPPPRTILIVFFDGEDMGRARHPEEFALGSKFWAENPYPEIPDEAILLDMIGDSDLEIPIEPFSERAAPELRQMLWETARNLDLPAFVDHFGPPVIDDHIPLQKIGIRAIDLIDFDYPYWHTIADTPDKCSPESLEQVGRLLVEFIYGE